MYDSRKNLNNKIMQPNSDQLYNYAVTLKSYDDLEAFYNEMESHGTTGHVPHRGIDCVRRKNISRTTIYNMTPNEAELLKRDQRVLDVQLVIGEDGRKIEPAFDFDKSNVVENYMKNWALLSSTQQSIENWGNDGIDAQSGSVNLGSMGENVDVVICDGHIDPNHPEFSVINTSPIENQKGAAYGHGGSGFSVFSAVSSDNGETWTKHTIPVSTGNHPSTCKGNVFCLINQNSTISATSIDGVNWSTGTLPVLCDWSAITHNDSIFCAVSRGMNNNMGSTIVATSSDGLTWTQHTLPFAAWESIAWNGSVFCAVSSNDDGRISATSTDGITWTQTTMPVYCTLSSIAWNGSVFCTVGKNTVDAFISSDGITWTQSTLPNAAEWSLITSNGQSFVVVANNNSIVAVSSDGITWSLSTLPISSNWGSLVWNDQDRVFCLFDHNDRKYISSNGITWSEQNGLINGTVLQWNGQLFCTIKSSTSATSPDGIVWTLGNLPVSNTWTSMAWDGSSFCAVSNGIIAVTSSDGLNWTTRTLPHSAEWTITSNGFSFIAVAKNTTYSIISSDGGQTWDEYTLPVTAQWKSVAYSQSLGLFCTVGNSSFAATSDGASDWEQIAIPDTTQWNAITCKDGTFCAISSISSITSNDANSWTEGTLPSNANWGSIAYNDSIYCIVAKNSSIAATSVDGINWTQRDLGITSNWNAISWNGSVFCIVSDNGNAMTSSDGVTWNSIVSDTLAWNSIVWNTNNFYAVTNTTISATSVNGIIWTQHTIPVSANWVSITTKNNILCAISDTTVSAVSTDGISWTVGTLVASNWKSITSNNNVFCAVNSSIVATSTDGIVWTESSLPISSNWYSLTSDGVNICIISNNNKITLMSNDNGVTWTQNNLPILSKWKSITSNGSLFCTVDSISTRTAVSSDGINWTQGKITPMLTTLNSVTWKNNVFLANGNGNYFATSNDGLVWSWINISISSSWSSSATDGSNFYVTDNSTILTTSNVSSWTRYSLPCSAIWSSISWNGSVLCAIGHYNIVPNSRVKQFNWSSLNSVVNGTDNGVYDYVAGNVVNNSHGNHVAGIACGNTNGWARNANIYNIYPYEDYDGAISASDIIDYIRVWHKSKEDNLATGKKNPTIVNMSWTHSLFLVPAIYCPYVNYQGNWYEGIAPNDQTPFQATYNGNWDAESLAYFNIVVDQYYYNNYGICAIPIAILNTALDQDILDATDEGIVFVGAAGNNTMICDVIDGINYNNVLFYNDGSGSGNFLVPYNQGVSPACAQSAEHDGDGNLINYKQIITVGSISANVDNKKSSFSNIGAKVNIWAPGENIMSAWGTPTHGDGSVLDTRKSSNYLNKNTGTSMAAPQITGLIASAMGKLRFDQKRALEFIQKHAAKDVIPNIDNPYQTLNDSFNGIANYKPNDNQVFQTRVKKVNVTGKIKHRI